MLKLHIGTPSRLKPNVRPIDHLLLIFDSSDSLGRLSKLIYEILELGVFETVLSKVSLQALLKRIVPIKEKHLFEPAGTFSITDTIKDVFSISSTLTDSCDWV